MDAYNKWIADQKYAAGNAALKRLKFNEATKSFTEAIARNDNNSSYYGQRGVAWFELGDYHSAFEDAQRAIQLDMSCANAHAVTINSLLALDDVVAAKNAYDVARELGVQIEHQIPVIQLLDILTDYNKALEDRDYDKCLVLMRDALHLCPASKKLQLNRAECLMRMNRFTEATNVVQKIIKQLVSSNAEVNYVLGLIYYHRDMLEKAMKYLDESNPKAKDLRMLIQNIIAAKEQANNFFQAGKFENALVVYKQILDMDVKDNDTVTSKLYYNCALMHFNQKRYREAQEDLTKALQINPDYFKAFVKRAQCEFNLGNFLECLSDYQFAFRLEQSAEIEAKFKEVYNLVLQSPSRPDDEQAAKQCLLDVSSLVVAGDFKQAIETCSQAIRQWPVVVPFYDQRIQCAVAIGNYQLAIQDSNVMRLLDACTGDRILLRIKCLVLNGDLDEARNDLKCNANVGRDGFAEIVELICGAFDIQKNFEERKYRLCLSLIEGIQNVFHIKLNSSFYQLIKAQCFYYLNDFEQALHILNDVIATDRSHASATYLKGLALYQMARLEEASEQLELSLECDAENEIARQLLNKVKKMRDKLRKCKTLSRNKEYSEAHSAFEDLAQMARVVKPNIESLIRKMKSDIISRPTDTNWSNLKDKLGTGLSHFKNENYEAASQMFANAFDTYFPDDALKDVELVDLIISAGSCYITLGNLSKAEAVFKVLQKQASDAPRFQQNSQLLKQLQDSIGQAIELFSREDYSGCLVKLVTVLKYSKRSEIFLLIKAECLVWLRDFKEADLIMESLASTSSIKYLKGLACYLQNDLEEAVELLKSCMDMDSSHQSARNLHGKVEAKIKRIAAGDNLDSDEIQEQPKPDAAGSLSDTSSKDCNLNENRKMSDGAAVDTTLIESLIRLYRLKEAKDNLQQLNSEKFPIDCHFLKGLLCFYSDDLKGAVDHFKNCHHTSLAKKVKQPEKIASEILGILKGTYNITKLTHDRDDAKIVKKLSKVISGCESHNDNQMRVKCLYQRALIYSKLESSSPDMVLADCSEALVLEPRYANALKLRVSVLRDTGRLDESIRDYKTLLAIDDVEEVKRAYENLLLQLQSEGSTAAAKDASQTKDLTK